MCLPTRYDKLAGSSPNTRKKTIRKRGVYIVVVPLIPGVVTPVLQVERRDI